MKKIKLEILGLSSSQSQQGSFALVLGEENGTRRLPIIIGMFEAQAIAIEMEQIIPHRPMTHDLFKSFAQTFKFSIVEIIISDLREGVFYAKIVCTDGLRLMEIDSRPSDAIAIGLRFTVPIYTNETIMSEAGIVLTDEEESQASRRETKTSVPTRKTTGESLKDLPFDQLQQMLNEALEKEDYERAAKIRDELNKRN
ncbi:MAG: bifunctional nuclease family protein [Verrucomicrobia bacterium]|nr:bifunctional nuclease family protein [Cytophagales bacterium]